MPDGEARAGTGVALVGGAAGAGVVRLGGTAGDGQAIGQWRVRPSQIGRVSNVRDHSRNHSLAGRDDPFADWSLLAPNPPTVVAPPHR